MIFAFGFIVTNLHRALRFYLCLLIFADVEFIALYCSLENFIRWICTRWAAGEFLLYASTHGLGNLDPNFLCWLNPVVPWRTLGFFVAFYLRQIGFVYLQAQSKTTLDFCTHVIFSSFCWYLVISYSSITPRICHSLNYIASSDNDTINLTSFHEGIFQPIISVISII